MVITVQEAAVVCGQELHDCCHRTFAREAHWRAQQQDGGVFHFPAYDTARDWQGPKLGEFSAKADWPRSRWKGLGKKKSGRSVLDERSATRRQAFVCQS